MSDGIDELFQAIDCISLRFEYHKYVKTLEHDRAKEKGLTECIRCGACCAVRPCVPTPDELKAIAAYLRMDLKDAVKKYFIGDRIGFTSNNIIFPAKKSQLDITGTFISAIRTYDRGYCVFYDEVNKECMIHAVKPVMAKQSYCWKDDEIDMDDIVITWSGVNLADYGIEFNDQD